MTKENATAPKPELRESAAFHAQALRLCWDQYSLFCSSIFPARWRMPPNYPSPEYVLPSLIGQIALAQELPEPPLPAKASGEMFDLPAAREFMAKNAKDPVLSAWLRTAAALSRYKARVYCVEPDLARDLLLTSPDNFDFDAVGPRLPLPGFVLSVPRGTITTADGDVLAIAVTVADGMFTIAAPLESGAAYTFISDTDTGAVFELLGDDVNYDAKGLNAFLRERPDATPEELAREMICQPGDKAALSLITSFTLNVLAFMVAGGEVEGDVEEGGRTAPAKRRSPRLTTAANCRDFQTPWVIGTRYARRVRPGHAVCFSGRSVRVHWRCGHWRRQPCGPGRKERRMLFVSPVLVNSKKKETPDE